MQQELDLLKGVVQKYEKQIGHVQKQVVEVMTINMANDVLVSGLCGDEDGEQYIPTVLNFMRNTMKIEHLYDNEVEAAFRRSQNSEKDQD